MLKRDLRVMILGSGGREHALAWKVRQSESVEQVLCVPGNGGMMTEPKVRCLVAPPDERAWVDLVRSEAVDLVVIGPEAPLVAGLADAFRSQGFFVVGPGARAAVLEGSKVAAKRFMQRHAIPTAVFETFDDPGQAIGFLRSHPGPWVIKADGLAAGKGVFPCREVSEAEEAIGRIMHDKAFGDAGQSVVVEEYLSGEEASCIALTDGKHIRLLASSQDHKRAFDGDEGPNTGGMGAYSPAPVMDSTMERLVVERVFRPVVDGMRAEGAIYTGFLYAGMMIDAGQPRVLEFNVRLGDPETQALLPRLRSDLVPALAAVSGLAGDLEDVDLEWSPDACVCVVMASEGYPGKVRSGVEIHGLDRASAMDGVEVFHAGTACANGRHFTQGGRVLGVCGLGPEVKSATRRSYAAVERIHFEGAHFRRDIAKRALARST